MDAASLDFFKALANAPSPSGYEQPAAKVFREYCQKFADKVETDIHGNVYAILNPEAETRIMLAGHIDEIGFVVHYISDEGFLYFSPVGGHDHSVPVGQTVWVHGASGRVPGVIGRKAIHLLEEEERKKKPEIKDMWIDIGATSRAEVEEVIALGDPVTYQTEFSRLRGDRATARGFDNKMGAFVVAEAARLLKQEGGLSPNVGVYAVATVQEEIGLRGARTSAYTTNAQTGIAVDVNHAIDYPGVSKARLGACDVGKGPTIVRGANINHKTFDLLVESAVSQEIPYQVRVSPAATSTDANWMQVSRSGMATGLIGVPLRYMHTPVELLSLTDVENCAKLMAGYCRLVKPGTDFTP